MDIIVKYFPELKEDTREKFAKLEGLYTEWNSKINVISRKDIESLYEKHILHSLAIAKVINFKPGTRILDIGTGGGFPGIPLAIMFPECQFTLVDSIGKKITVVNEVAKALNLTNLKAFHCRAETVKEKFHFVVSRAVTAMPDFIKWTYGKFEKEQKNTLANGILYLKGGDLADELSSINNYTTYPISKYFNEEFFETKVVVYIPMR